jgi:putative transposase
MDIRRYYYPGQIVFITQIVKNRKHVFNNPEIMGLLLKTLQNVKLLHPFDMLAYVFLPDHFHILICPTGESNFSQIMHSVKFNFSRVYKQRINHIDSLTFWQKRFWDHVIRDETDLENHIHYFHYNPVKHGYVSDLQSWRNSSYAEWQERGLYDNLLIWDEPDKCSWGE